MKARTVVIILSMVALTVALSAGAASGSFSTGPGREQALFGQAGGLPTRQIMIQFGPAVDEAELGDAAGAASLMARLSEAAGEEVSYVRPMSGGAHVLAIGEARTPAEVAAISARLAALPDVLYAEPDLIKTIDRSATLVPLTPGLTPNDSLYTDQWHYKYAAGTSEGLNLPPAWDITTGSASTIVAVLDTGILSDHPDIAGRTVPGYDMISDTFVANDGDGRDADPSDPGDWIEIAECGNAKFYPSSWHGTHVAGTIGAASNNGVGVAGINWQAKILPVRVLGKCGGTTSDIIDAVRWASGLAVTGAPANANPADVINLSLGGYGACSTFEQAAFNDAVAAGVTVVIAAGNSNDDAANHSPGNCNNVITVAATNRSGNRAFYSNYGSVVEVAAPGGDTSSQASNGILSTLNDGARSPGTHTYVYYQGTSMAAPHVAGLASLIKGLQPGYSPAQVLAVLEDHARAFPAGSSCTSICGAGIVDAFASLLALPSLNVEPVSHLPLVVRAPVVPTVSFSSASFSAGEGDGQAVLAVKLDQATTQVVTVGYSTANNTASAGEDYVQKSDTLTFNPGQTSKNIQVTLLNDTKKEDAETFFVDLHTPGNAVIGSPARATVTIWDNDQGSTVPNGDFEQGATIWTEYSKQGWPLIMTQGDGLPKTPHSGQYAAWLGGDNLEIAYVQQTLTIPAGSPYFTYWHWISSSDACGYDFAGVVVNGTTVADQYDLCSAENTGGWVKHSVNLSTWAGQTVPVQIRVETDDSVVSNLYVDDVSFSASPAPPAGAGSSYLGPSESPAEHR